MRQSQPCEQRLRQLIGTDLPADEVERLARVDALLRLAADHDRVEGASLLLRAPWCDSRPTTVRSRTRTSCYPRAGRRSRACERAHLSISAALDGELSELESTRMREHVDHCRSCAAFEADSETLAKALRTEPPEPLSAPTNPWSASASYANNGEAVRSTSKPVATRAAVTPAAWRRIDNETHELKLTFAELALIYKSLQAAKTLGALPPQDELLNETIQLVDLALKKAV